MKLENLLYGVEIQKTNVDLNTEIKEIKIDSRKVEKGDLFICLELRLCRTHRKRAEKRKIRACKRREKSVCTSVRKPLFATA